MIFAAIGGADTIAIAPKVRHYNVESLCQSFGNFVKACMGLRIAMKQ